jgi:hypothetical protein
MVHPSQPSDVDPATRIGPTQRAQKNCAKIVDK